MPAAALASVASACMRVPLLTDGRRPASSARGEGVREREGERETEGEEGKGRWFGMKLGEKRRTNGRRTERQFGLQSPSDLYFFINQKAMTTCV